MSMYPRPGNIYCILMENSMKSMNTWCLEESTPHVKFGPALQGLPPSYMMTLKPPPPHLFVPPDLINKTIMARYHI